MFLKIHKSNITEKSFWSFIRTQEFTLKIYLVPNSFISREYDRMDTDYANIPINIYEIKKYLVRKIILKTYISNINLTLPMDGKYYTYKELTTDCTFIINVKDEFFILNRKKREAIQLLVSNSELKGSILVQLTEGNNRMRVVDFDERIYRVDDLSYKVLNDLATVSAQYRVLDNFNFYFSIDPCFYLSHEMILTTNFELSLKDLKYSEIMLKGKSGTKSIYISRKNLLKSTLMNFFPRGILSIIDCKMTVPNLFLDLYNYEEIIRHVNKQLYVVYVNEVGIDQGSIMKDYITTLGNVLLKDRRVEEGKNGFYYFKWKECECINDSLDCPVCVREIDQKIQYYDRTEDIPSVLFYALLGYYLIIALKTNSTIPMRIAYSIYSIMVGHPVYLRSIQDEKIMHTVRYEQGEWMNDFTGLLDDLDIRERSEEMRECAFLFSEYYYGNYKGYNILYMLYQLFILEREDDLFTDLKNSFYLFSNCNFKKLNLKSDYLMRKCCAMHSFIQFTEKKCPFHLTPLSIYFLLTGIHKIAYENIKKIFIFKNFNGNDFLIDWFHEILQNFYENDIIKFRNFMKFATGSETITYTDLYVYKIKITVIRAVGIDQYIRSASCSKTVVMSLYSSKEKMREMIVDSSIEGNEFLIA